MLENQNPPAASAMERKAPVLVVDDDLTIVDIVRETLELEDIEVVTASSGLEALRQLETQQFSIVLLDMRMPVMDGWQFANRARDQGLNLTIVVMTAAPDASKWAREIGAVDYLEKPFDLGQLIAVIERSPKNGST